MNEENENLLIKRCPPHFDVLRTVRSFLSFLILRRFSFSIQSLFFFANLRNPRAYYTPNEVDRTESERISRRRLPRHERENRILQNVLWHARTWPVRHKRWPTRRTQPRQLRQRGTQWLAVTSIARYWLIHASQTYVGKLNAKQGFIFISSKLS